MLTPAKLHRFCLDLPGAVEEFPFRPGLSVFKVAGKVFALCPLRQRPLRVSLKCEPALAELGGEPPSISLKCEPGLALQLRADHAAITPGYHLNKRHWNTVEVDGSLSDRLVLDMVEDSYDLVVAGLPKRTQATLGWPPG